MSSEKKYVLIGERSLDSDVVLIAYWNKLPSQATIDILVTKLKRDYVRFAVMEDILFITGSKEPDEQEDYFAY